jgi:antirestriction protein ArdC
MRSKTRPSMAELRGFHALLAALLHIIDTSRLLTVLKNDTRAIFAAASHAQKAADFLKSLQPQTEEPAARLAA